MCGWGGSGGKGQRKHAVYCRWVSVREPDCMRVPRQGPHGGGAVRCYTGNVPMRHAFCTRARCGVRELRAGVDPLNILKSLKATTAPRRRIELLTEPTTFSILTPQRLRVVRTDFTPCQ